jgi:hypothetical protein
MQIIQEQIENTRMSLLIPRNQSCNLMSFKIDKYKFEEENSKSDL